MSDGSLTPKKGRNDFEELEAMTKEELIAKIREQDAYVKQLESKRLRFDRGDEDGDSSLQERLKQQQRESTRRENTLVHRLTTKEQELQEFMNQIQEMKQSQTQASTQLRSMLLDPAVNIVFQRMGKELEECQEKLKQTQNELSAWKFTPDSQTGKQLMTRCRNLLQENEDLGKQIASGRTAKLEGEIALQKTLVTEMKENQADLDEFLGELEEDTEGMQSVIYVLQQQLRDTKEQLSQSQVENTKLRSRVTCDDDNKDDVKMGSFSATLDSSKDVTYSPIVAVKTSSSPVKRDSLYDSDTDLDEQGGGEIKMEENLGEEESYNNNNDEYQTTSNSGIIEGQYRSNCEDNFSQHSSPPRQRADDSPIHNNTIIKEEAKFETTENNPMEVDHVESRKTTYLSNKDKFDVYQEPAEESARADLEEEEEDQQLEEEERDCTRTDNHPPTNVDVQHEEMETDHVQHCSSSPLKDESPSLRTSGETAVDNVNGDPSNSGDLNVGTSAEQQQQDEEEEEDVVELEMIQTERTDSGGEKEEEDSSSPPPQAWRSSITNTNGDCADNFHHSKGSPADPAVVICHPAVSKDITSMVDREDDKEEILQNGVSRTSTVDDIEDL